MANPVLNPSFEVPGLSWGQAESWTESYSSGSEDIALFYDGQRYLPWEAFDTEWDNTEAQLAFGAGDLAAALFETYSPHEDFETTWAMPSAPAGNGVWNHHYQLLFTSGMLQQAGFGTGPLVYEGFEQEWTTNETSEFGYAPVVSGGGTVLIGTFTDGIPEDIEDFEEDWLGNSNAETGYSPLVVGGATSSAALFDGATLAYEGFGGTWTMTYP